MARLKNYYRDELVAKLMTELKLDNVMEVPSVEKITLNMGVGDAAKDSCCTRVSRS
jgi:large subunit ribosomal protein L5